MLAVNYRSITIVLRGTESYPEITVDFARLPKRRLDCMLAAGTEAVECIQVLSKTGDNIAGELLKGRENFLSGIIIRQEMSTITPPAHNSTITITQEN